MKTLWLLVVGVAVAGCVSTPARRIEREPALFASFPTDVQAKVRRGEVAVGFTRDMVRLALGAPHRVNTRLTEQGAAEVWVYTTLRHVSRYEPVHAGTGYRGRSGRLYRACDLTWMDMSYPVEIPAMRVEFEGGKVKAIERAESPAGAFRIDSRPLSP
jgi:outer membrane protein assembly factor BamE (lipoprotein component of BamABCDE complex)